MWVLKNEDNTDCFILIRDKVKYTIGRAGADLILPNDSSISRTHAYLHLNVSEGNEVLEVEDAGSKYGTFVNDGVTKNEQITKGQRIALNPGDRIRFGLLKNIWNISHQRFATMASALSQDQSNLVDEYLKVLGGTILQGWNSNCTHLTTSEVAITVKVLHALLDETPIVTSKYWRDMVQAARRGRASLPSPELYIPRCGDVLLQQAKVNLKSRPERKHIFDGMTFVFMNRKHRDTYAPIVQKAGGTCRDLNSGVKKAFLSKSNVAVIQYVPSTQSQSSQTISDIEEFLESHSRRTIPEYEIGLAIVHCSTEKYCNSSYKVLGNLMPSTEVAAMPDTILVENTSSVSCRPESQITDVIIPATEEKSQLYIATSSASTADNIIPELECVTTYDSSREEDIAMPNIQVTESVEQRVDDSQSKRKRVAENLNVGNDDSDEELFQFAKRPHISKKNEKQKIESEKPQDEAAVATPSKPAPSSKGSASKSKTTPTARAKPLPIITSKGKKSVNTSGFLQKHGPEARNSEKASTSLNDDFEAAADKPPETRKRRRIAVISDDDDDDDLFNFVGTKNSQAGKKSRATNANDSDDELFAFTELPHNAAKKVQGNTNTSGDDDDDDLEPTQEFIPKENKKSVLKPLPKPKPLPQKINVEGWLSCSLNNMSVKEKDAAGTNVKKEEDDPNQEWINSIKCGFEVHPISISIHIEANNTLQHSDIQRNNTASTSTLNNNSSCKNFKAFVKQPNAHPQKRIITTKSAPLTHQRLR